MNTTIEILATIAVVIALYFICSKWDVITKHIIQEVDPDNDNF